MNRLITAARGLLDRVGGPSAVTLRGVLLIFLPSLIPTMLYDSSSNGGSPIAWGLVGAAGTIAGAIPILLLGHWLLPVRPRPARPAIALGVFAIGGVVRGATIGIVSVSLGLATSPQFAFRIAGGVALAVCWFSLAAIIIDAWSRHRALVESLERRRLTALTERAAAESELRSTRDRVRDTLLVQITTLLSLLTSAMQAGSRTEDVRRVALAMHDTVSDVVRPLSHSVNARHDPTSTPGAPPSTGEQAWRRARTWLRLITGDALTIDPFHPVITALVVTPSSLPAAVRVYGPGIGMLGAFAIGLLAWLVLEVARRVYARRAITVSRWSWAPAVAAYLLMGAACASVPMVADATNGGSLMQGWLAGGQVLFILTPLAALGAAVVAAEDRRRSIAERDREATVAVAEWASRRVQQESWAARHRLARELHSGIQSELTAAALRLDWWTQRPDLSTLPAVLEQVRAAADHVATLLQSGEAAQVTDPKRALDAVAAVWQDLTTITVAIDPNARTQLSYDPDAAESVIEVVRESLSNAVRHGRATTITATVALHQSQSIEVLVEDNGRGLAATVNPGMGSRVLDDVCLAWDRTSTWPGARLRAVLPVRAHDDGFSSSDGIDAETA